MAHFPRPHPERRAPRIHPGQLPAIVFQEDGGEAKAKLQTISVTGGMLRLPDAMQRGDFVEVTFHSPSGIVRGMAEMLGPMPTTKGALQPFRFVALADDDHRNLSMMVQTAVDRSFLGNPGLWSAES